MVFPSSLVESSRKCLLMAAVSPCRKASNTLNSLTDCSIDVVDPWCMVVIEPLRGACGDREGGDVADALSGLLLVMVVTR